MVDAKMMTRYRNSCVGDHNVTPLDEYVDGYTAYNLLTALLSNIKKKI